MTLVIKKPTANQLVLRQTYVGTDDPDAATYIAAVEAADGQALEIATCVAIHSFVKGCKADRTWPAIKASCILAGARTLAGALVPLVGTAPARFGTEGGWSYSRKTGLQGNGTSNYLNANRGNSVDPQDSKHVAVYASSALSGGVIGAFEGTAATGATWIARDATTTFIRVNSGGSNSVAEPAATGFVGASRASSSTASRRLSSVTSTFSQGSTTPEILATHLFRQGNGSLYSSTRLAFYSIGEALDLALLDTRVTTLINALAIAIP